MKSLLPLIVSPDNIPIVKNFFPLLESLEDLCLLDSGLSVVGPTNVSQLIDNQAEVTISVNPSNPTAQFLASMHLPKGDIGPGLFAANTFGGGGQWNTSIIATGSSPDSLPAAAADPKSDYDAFGNLYLSYLTPNDGLLQKGTASAGGANTLTDQTKNWATNQWAGGTLAIEVTAGTGAGQSLAINTNTNNQITVFGNWTVVPDNTSQYEIKTITPQERSLILARSTDNGQSFHYVTTIARDEGIDFPSIATGPAGTGQPGQESVWVVWREGGGVLADVRARGALVTGLGQINNFSPDQEITTPFLSQLPEVAIGPSGQVLVTFQSDAIFPSPSGIVSSVDPDGLGAQPFQQPVTAAVTFVTTRFSLPAQQNRQITARAQVGWDRLHNIAYLVYTYSPAPETVDTDIYLTSSTDNGGSWGEHILVNQPSPHSQFLPAMDIDQDSGNVAVAWYDTHDDPTADERAHIYASVLTFGAVGFSEDVRVTPSQSNANLTNSHQKGTSSGNNQPNLLNDSTQNWHPNYWVGQQVVITGGPGSGQQRTITANTATQLTVNQPWTQNAVPDNTSTYEIRPVYEFDYGDYIDLAFVDDAFYPVWADNSNSTFDNPDGILRTLDIYTAEVRLGADPDPIPTGQKSAQHGSAGIATMPLRPNLQIVFVGDFGVDIYLNSNFWINAAKYTDGRSLNGKPMGFANFVPNIQLDYDQFTTHYFARLGSTSSNVELNGDLIASIEVDWNGLLDSEIAFGSAKLPNRQA